MSAVLGTLAEAWSEVRVNRSRVVLSLVGVFCAVFAMTIVTAAGQMAGQSVQESLERFGGRDATVSVSLSTPDGSPADVEAAAAASTALVERFGVTHHSVVVQNQVDLPPLPGQPAPPPEEGTLALQVTAVEPAYGTIHRIDTPTGRWFVPDDAEALAPVVVVNPDYLEQTGLPPAPDVPFATTLGGGERTQPTTVTVVGVTGPDGGPPTVTMLPSGLEALPAELREQPNSSVELWVPPDQADAIADAVPSVLVGSGVTGSAYASSGGGFEKVLTGLEWGLRAVSLLVLALASLGVLNVGIVTVRQRVREIGVRRALGASSARVFAAIMLESVVATAVAGALGVAAAVALVVNLPLELLTESIGVSALPAFPVSAALEAFVAATVVGALVGLVPATVAVRAKVIDAIRY